MVLVNLHIMTIQGTNVLSSLRSELFEDHGIIIRRLRSPIERRMELDLPNSVNGEKHRIGLGQI
jgi:hypothetical protein